MESESYRVLLPLVVPALSLFWSCALVFGHPKLSTFPFQGLLMLLQNLPTIHWGNEEIGLLLAEAYRLKYMFADAPNHYRR